MKYTTLILFLGASGAMRFRPLVLTCSRRSFRDASEGLTLLREDIRAHLSTARPGNPTPVSQMDVIRFLALLDGTEGACKVELDALGARGWGCGEFVGNAAIVYGVEAWLEGGTDGVSVESFLGSVRRSLADLEPLPSA